MYDKKGKRNNQEKNYNRNSFQKKNNNFNPKANNFKQNKPKDKDIIRSGNVYDEETESFKFVSHSRDRKKKKNNIPEMSSIDKNKNSRAQKLRQDKAHNKFYDDDDWYY